MSDTLYQYNQDGIQFNGVKEPGIAVQNAIITTNNNYEPDERQPNVISGKKNNIINAIDIDWNSADINLINKSASINTSGQMLKLYADSINTSYSLANSAYNLAQTAIEANNIDQDTISQIQSILSNGVISSLREPITSFYKSVNPDRDGSIKLGCISKESYIPINIEFNYNDHEVDFGISYNNIDEHIRSVANDLSKPMLVHDSNNDGGWTNNIKFTGYTDDNYIPVYSLINSTVDELKLGINKSDIPSANYTGDNTYINVDNNKISLNENAILSYLKTTELNKNYTRGIGIDINNNIISTKFNCKRGIGTNNDDDDARNLFIVLARENSYLKFVDDSSALAVDIDAVKAYIGNSGQGQTITVDSELSSTSTNPVQNKIINNQILSIYNQISNINTNLNNNYVKVDGETTGTLAVIHGNTINASTATTNGNDIYISSDRRLKDNILDITEGEVERLFESESGNMHYFEWKENHKPSFGFIAQELIGFAPEAVTSDSEYMQVNYNAALTKTCAALFKKIKQLEERIKILEGES